MFSGKTLYSSSPLYSLSYNLKVAANLMQGVALRWTSISFRVDMGEEIHSQSLQVNENVDK